MIKSIFGFISKTTRENDIEISIDEINAEIQKIRRLKKIPSLQKL